MNDDELDSFYTELLKIEGKAERSKKKMLAKEEIIRRVRQGEIVNKILKEKHLPTIETHYNWMERDHDYAKAYNQAVKDRTHGMLEEALAKVESSRDIFNLQKAKTYFDIAKFIASKQNGAAYGDKVVVEGGDKPITLLGLINESYQVKKSTIEGAAIEVIENELIEGEDSANE